MIYVRLLVRVLKKLGIQTFYSTKGVTLMLGFQGKIKICQTLIPISKGVDLGVLIMVMAVL